MTLQAFLKDPRCVFCGKKFVQWQNYWQCAEHNGDDMTNGIWCSWLNSTDNFESVHIVVNRMQVSYFLMGNFTQISRRSSIKDHDTLQEIIRFEGLFELPLEPELLERKLKTIAVFS